MMEASEPRTGTAVGRVDGQEAVEGITGRLQAWGGLVNSDFRRGQPCFSCVEALAWDILGLWIARWRYPIVAYRRPVLREGLRRRAQLETANPLSGGVGNESR